MDINELIAAIDAVVKLGTFVGNAMGSADTVGALIAERIKSGANVWTDAQLAIVEDLDKAARARAIASAATPDAPAV